MYYGEKYNNWNIRKIHINFFVTDDYHYAIFGILDIKL